jgi:hypothetical protein
MDDAIELATTDLTAQALALARAHVAAPIVNHSVRTFLHAGLAATAYGLRAGSDYDRDELFCACILHDIGAADAYDGPQRFEVEGADAAASFLGAHGFWPDAIARVWEAIALHTSPGIAERLGPLTRLTRAGVTADFGRLDVATAAQRASIEARYPRLDVERCLGDAVVRQAVRQPAKAPRSSWPGGLLQAHLADPDATGPNPAF